MKSGSSLLVAFSLLLASASCQAPGDRGFLLVRTQTFTYDAGENQYQLHEPYDVLDPTGALVLRVENHPPGTDESGPTRVSLPPGNYLIRASTPDGQVEIPVVVERGKVTKLRVQ